VYAISPGSVGIGAYHGYNSARPGHGPNQTFGHSSGYNTSLSCQASPDQYQDRRHTRSFTSTPVNRVPVTGRVGYNNTPVVTRRDRESFVPIPGPGYYNRDGYNYKSHKDNSYKGSLTRSSSAYDYCRSEVENDVYTYQSRVRPVDLVHSDDEIITRRYNKDDVIELPSGARQKISRVYNYQSRGNNMPPASDARGSSSNDKMRGPELRQRRRVVDSGTNATKASSESTSDTPETQHVSGHISDLAQAFNTVTGYLIMLLLSYQFSVYLCQLHDNDLWFSEIMEVEREISFRTEQGLYYSYFKQLVHSKSLSVGFQDLQCDNKTESGHSINILQRFNIYQEVVLAAVYKIYDFRLKPILFYTYSVFCLQGVYLSSLYLISWTLSGSWLTGVLTSILVCVNRFDVTRVQFTVPLREHFSLPFIFMQFFFVGKYLSFRQTSSNYVVMTWIYISGVLFTICWQFSQFVMLIQSLVLFVLATVGLADRERVCRVLLVFLTIMLTVWYLQFYQTMLITSLVVSLVPVAVLSLQSQSDLSTPVGLLNNIAVASLRVIVALAVTVCLNIITKIWLNQTADNHIFKFLKNKFAQDSTDFETQLYLCNEAFKWLGAETYKRMLSGMALPVYLLYTLLMVASYVSLTCAKWRQSSGSVETNNQTQAQTHTVLTRSDSKAKMYHSAQQKTSVKAKLGSWYLEQLSLKQDTCFHVALSVCLGLLAVSTLRMKCFWSPYICLLASAGVADPTLWSMIISKGSGGCSRATVNLVRHIALVCFIIVLVSKHKPVYEQEMSDLREFYDPDTVDLMQWLEQRTPPDSVISGSMQLMAGVKLCSGRTITNHPHFEDLSLRERTKELYQVYAKSSPETVHAILTRYKANYVILEDSICLAHRERCGLPDIMDLTNGHIPEDGIKSPPHLVHSNHPRFCEEVRYDNAAYRRFFKKVFENKTFRIYEIL